MLATIGIVRGNNCEEFMQKRMQHQGGWAATFVVVGVLLLAGLVGGVYFLKTRTDQVATSDNVSSETERVPDEANSNNEMPSQEQQPKQDAATPDPEKDKDESQPQTSPKQDVAQNTTNLPETGPADVFVKLIAVTALTAASVGYLRSR